MALCSVPNPDFNQRHAPGPHQPVRARSLRLMQAKVREYIRKWALGGGNWPEPPVYNERGRVVGVFSYNLRFWRANRRTGRLRCEEVGRA